MILSVTGELYSQLGLQGKLESYGGVKAKKSVFKHKYSKWHEMGMLVLEYGC